MAPGAALEAATADVAVTATGSAPGLVEVQAPMKKTHALRSPDGRGVTIAARQKYGRVFFDGVYQDVGAATVQEFRHEHGISSQGLAYQNPDTTGEAREGPECN